MKNKFIIKKASDFGYLEEKYINTLEELILFISNVGSIIIHPLENNGDMSIYDIMIYDDYVE